MCCCSQQAVDFIRERLARGLNPTECTNELLNACLANDPREARGVGCDNMTAALILFSPASSTQQAPQPNQQQPAGTLTAAASAAAQHEQQPQQQHQAMLTL